ncbi:Uu.00g102630.m01.CDS01 [Anthostomella pinea]|uniref:Uu.00g102630.m01.CDS01 n=1 Tax=Anthostomella pinea TaxID=933095 RepID=A0AAI8V8A6_9PEZI|nr:Uu.00g102630.m01.CDS01 [Anthostomella pinea]
MDFRHIPYPDQMSYPIYIASPEMDLPMDGVIDPSLKRSASPGTLPVHWNPPQMQRYLTDSNKSSFFGYPMADPVLPGTVAPFPSSLLQRQHSPSYSHPSSTCSSALSPPRESDYCQVHSPSTPTDAPMSPYSTQYDNCSTQVQLYEFTGLADAFVKPIDVNPYQETPPSYYEEARFRSDLSTRTYSMSSDSSNASIDQCNSAEQYQVPRHLSPESLTPEVKEEICIPDADKTYHPIEAEDDAISGDIEPFNLKNEDDDEYEPNKKPRRAATRSNHSTKNRKRPSTLQPTAETKRIKLEPDDSRTIQTPAKPAIQGTRGQFPCSDCPKLFFKDENGLKSHIKKQHTRPFTCVFEFAGCPSTFASKNEWKRHCCSQHLILNYWVCQQDQCAKVSNNATSKSTVSARNRNNSSRCHPNATSTLPNGTIFNRKDLYTQHLRRMHIPSSFKKQVKQKKSIPGWDEQVRAHQEEACKTRCQLPGHMRCPAINCSIRFDGPNAWDDRMEHVAKHLEKASTGAEPPLKFGGDNDHTLMNWAASPDVAIISQDDKGMWVLRNPLKPNSQLPRRAPVQGSDEDEDDNVDAEGEEIDE